MKRSAIFSAVVVALVFHAGAGWGNDPGFFRTLQVEPPDRGVLRMTSTSFHTDITANPVLRNRYSVGNSRIFSSVTAFELGVTDYLTATGSLPYYADLFTQQGKSGRKTGAGDVVVGLRISHEIPVGNFRALTLGGRYRIPEQLGYGPEPLGFRTFSYGKSAWSLDTALGFRMWRSDVNVSMSMIRFPSTSPADSVFTSDTFYDTGMGYLGIGRYDASGFAGGIFQNQLQLSVGAAVPVKPWLAGLMEYSVTSFMPSPKRETIVTLTPGIRLGTPEGFQLTAGVDYALGGQIPVRTFMLRLRVPTLSVREIKQLLTRQAPGPEVRSRNALVAVKDFTTSDYSYLYEQELRASLARDLGGRGIMEPVSAKRISSAMQQESLIPVPDTPQQLGARLGANYLITTEVVDYKVSRLSNFSLPFLISFPETDFELVTQSSVTDLVDGKTYSLGTISAMVARPRGVSFFPTGESSDIVYLSEPERREAERELIDRWVDAFNQVMMEHIELFGWEPRNSGAVGIEDVPGG